MKQKSTASRFQELRTRPNEIAGKIAACSQEDMEKAEDERESDGRFLPKRQGG